MAARWQDAAAALLRVIDRLEAQTPGPPRHVLLAVAADLRGIELGWCSADGVLLGGLPTIHLALPALPAQTDRARDDGRAVPHAGIDRAISMVAADMLSWSKDPETLELRAHQRHRLHLRWPGAMAEGVDEYAYGLWDE